VAELGKGFAVVLEEVCRYRWRPNHGLNWLLLMKVYARLLIICPWANRP
jgi:hypothetical protein